MTKRGRVLRDTNVGPGMLTVEGKQYSFLLEGMWRSEVPPRAGTAVDVIFDVNGAPTEVYAVSESQIAKEQAEQALAGAKRHGGVMVGEIRSRFGILPLIAEGVMLFSFFSLPNLFVGNEFARHGLTGWEVVGLDISTQMTNNHGFLSLLAIICLFAPVAVSFWVNIWSRWLYALPLAFAAVAFATTYLEIQNAASAAGRGMATLMGREGAEQMSSQVTGMFSLAGGAYLVLVCAIYLATRSLKSPRHSMTSRYAGLALLVLTVSFASACKAQQATLEVRHITIGMTPEQVEAAARAAGMHKNPARGNSLTEYLDPRANGQPAGGNDFSSGGDGLVLQIRFEDGKASMIVVQEQGDTTGQVGEDLMKTWGPPKSQYSNPSGHTLPWWGQAKGVYAELQRDLHGFYGVNVTIYGPEKPPSLNKGVRM